MPRPRLASDEEILAATGRLAMRLGPHRMTLAEVGREVGVSASALVQRFGSKRGLLLALADRAPVAAAAAFAEARAQHASPLESLVEALAREASDFGSAEQVSASLALVQLDLTDPDFRRLALAYFDAMRERVRTLLEEASQQRELKPTDLDALARAVEVIYNGSLLTWALRQEGDAGEAMRDDLEAVIAPHRTQPLVRSQRRFPDGSPGGAGSAARRGRARGP